jgi:hypothetical protein
VVTCIDLLRGAQASLAKRCEMLIGSSQLRFLPASPPTLNAARAVAMAHEENT